MTSTIKVVICTTIAALPSVYWAPVSTVVRFIWPGFRRA